LKKYDLQESYNNFKIKLKISLNYESGPWYYQERISIIKSWRQEGQPANGNKQIVT